MTAARHAPKLTAERLRELLKYDPETGVFTWKDARKAVSAGSANAGTLHRSGRIYIGIDYGHYKAHRLAWLYMTGEWPIGEVDHENTVPGDNRWTNLRDVVHQTNMQNLRVAHKDSRTGFLGVGVHESGLYRAQITVNGKQKHLGLFRSAEEAHERYVTAKRQLHEGCTI